MEAFPVYSPVGRRSGIQPGSSESTLSVEVSTFSLYLPFRSLLSTLEKVLRYGGGQKEVELGVGTPLI